MSGQTAPAPGRTTLPAETAAPPGGIGSDRALLHFDVDLAKLPGNLASRIAMTEWVSGEGYEQFTGMDADFRPVVAIKLGSDPDTVKGWVFANAGSTRAVQWRLGGVDGLSALDWDDRDLLPEVARAVRLDAVQRCVMPLRLAELPEGAHWSECQTAIRRGGPGPKNVWVYSGLTVERADGKIILIWADGRPRTETSSFAADRTIAGRPAQWRAEAGQFGDGLWIPDFGGYELYLTDFESHATWFTPAEATWYTLRLTPSANLDDPSTWPLRAVG